MNDKEKLFAVMKELYLYESYESYERASSYTAKKCVKKLKEILE